MNQVILSGNVGNDPTHFNGGCNLSLATTEGYKDKNGEWQNTTTWHRLTFYGKLADNAPNKGAKLTIMGKIVYSEYEKEGVKVQSTTIQVLRIL